jgi:hypothetical protein
LEFFRDHLDSLPHDIRGEAIESLTLFAGRAQPSWQAPPAADPTLLDEVDQFVTRGRRRASGDPSEVDELLQRATRVFLGGDLELALTAWRRLLAPLSEGEIHLGEDELINEVLSTNLHEVMARCLLAAYCLAPLEARAEALWKATDEFGWLSYLSDPIREMETVSTKPLPDLNAFLPSWFQYLQTRVKPDAAGRFEDATDGMLREAAARSGGASALRDLARGKGGLFAWHDWVRLLVVDKRWKEAAAALVEAAGAAREGSQRASFLDSAGALAMARQTGDVADLLAQAWRAKPSVPRLMRLYGATAAGDRPALLRQELAFLRTTKSVPARVLGVLTLLDGRFAEAAQLLAACNGLGWSSEDHPGRFLFPALSFLAAGPPQAGSCGEVLLKTLQGNDDVEAMLERDSAEGLPPLQVVDPLPLLADLRRSLPPTPETVTAIVDALRAAALRRVKEATSQQRRSAYEHAVFLVAATAEVFRAIARPLDAVALIDLVQTEYRRYSALQSLLNRCLRKSGVRFVPRQRR